VSGPVASVPSSSPWDVRVSDVAAVLGLTGQWADQALRAVCTDSRSLQPAELFVALPGARVDGHAFVAEALRSGAGALLVERALELPDAGAGRVLQVSSTLGALTRLADWWRQRIAPAVIAITGSNGKTTVKEMVACVLMADARARGQDPAGEVLATQGNFNNHLGLPLTLLRLRPGHRRAVLELGMNHAGELTALSALARPDVALVNNVQRAHVGLLGTLQGVARAKAEIYSGLGGGGVAVLNADDPHADLLAQHAAGHRILRFSRHLSADVGPVLGAHPSADGGQSVRFRVGTDEHRCDLPLPGRHNVSNLLAAVAAVLPLGIAPAQACAALAGFGGVPGRLRRQGLADGTLLIDDTYNANPDSVLAAIAVLAERPGRQVLVLGDLGELGSHTKELHAELGRAARAAGIAHFFGLGTAVADTAAQFGPSGRTSQDPAELLDWLQPLRGPDTTMLIKGSRFMRMERIVEGLTR